MNLKKTEVMVSGLKGEVLKSKVDPCAKCGKRVMANAVYVQSMVNGYTVDAETKRVTSTLALGFACEICVYTKERIMEPGEELSFFDQVDFVKSFCYLGDRLNASGGSEASVTA